MHAHSTKSKREEKIKKKKRKKERKRATTSRKSGYDIHVYIHCRQTQPSCIEYIRFLSGYICVY